MPHISGEALKALQSSDDFFLLIDVRTEAEYKAGHLAGAIWMPRGELEFMVQERTKEPLCKIVLYCRTGGRGALSTQALMQMGYSDVLNLTGGFKQWVGKGNSIYNMHGELRILNFEKKAGSGQRSLAGGWSISEVTPEVEQALDYVLAQMNNSAKLDEILEVKTQVVAGKNYDIEFRLDNGSVWEVIVFRDLSGDFSMKHPATKR